MASGLCEAVGTRATLLGMVWSPCNCRHWQLDWGLAVVKDGVYLVSLELGLLVGGISP